jgi:hypothetical protein
MLAMRKSAERVPDASCRVAGGLNDDVDLGRCEQSLRIFGNERRAAPNCCREGRRGISICRPARPSE